jgi:hypothetical protein
MGIQAGALAPGERASRARSSGREGKVVQPEADFEEPVAARKLVMAVETLNACPICGSSALELEELNSNPLRWLPRLWS